MGPFVDFKGFNFDKLCSNLYIYTGIFIDTESRNHILERFPPIHPNIFVDHITLCFKPSFEEVMATDFWTDDNGEKVPFEILESAEDEFGQAVKVRIRPWVDTEHLPCRNEILHITISCADGISASYSNKLLQNSTCKPLKASALYCFNGDVGVCMYSDRQFVPEYMWKRRGLISR